MKGQNKAVIIGAGVGGIATSIFLAQKGYSVDVYEKNADPGGRCGQIYQHGHRFDLGATILLMPSLYREVFTALGLDMDKELEPTSPNHFISCFSTMEATLNFRAGTKECKSNLKPSNRVVLSDTSNMCRKVILFSTNR